MERACRYRAAFGRKYRCVHEPTYLPELNNHLPFNRQVEDPHSAPCQRSLHVAAVFEDGFYIFGGYDGQSRVNDFHGFSFPKKAWFVVQASGKPPTPRDRHTAVVHDKSFYVFAGFDGTNRVNDFHAFDFKSKQWKTIVNTQPPSARHSHACVIYGHSVFCFGGSVLLFHSRMDLLLIFIVVAARWQLPERLPRIRVRDEYLGVHCKRRPITTRTVPSIMCRLWQTSLPFRKARRFTALERCAHLPV